MESDFIPTDIREAAKNHLLQLRETNNKITDQLIRLLTELEQETIEAVVYKGPALSQLIYGDTGLRVYRDLDFLISKNEIPATMRVLDKLGYRTRDYGIEMTPLRTKSNYDVAGEEILFGGEVPVEPHWSFTPSFLAIDLDYSNILARRRYLRMKDKTVATLSSEDGLLALLLHGTKERWRKLKWVSDIADYVRASQAMNWDLFLQLAADAGLKRMVLAGLSLTDQLMPIPIPQNVRSQIAADHKIRGLNQKALRQLFDPNRKDRRGYQFSPYIWGLRERTSDRVHYLHKLLTTPRMDHYQWIQLPDSLFSGYYLVKIVYDYLLAPLRALYKTIHKRPSSQILSGDKETK